MRFVFLTEGLRCGHGVAVATAWLADALGDAEHDPVIYGASAAEAAAMLGRTPRFDCVPAEPIGGSVSRRALLASGRRSSINRLAGDCYVPVGFPYNRLAGRLNAPTIVYDHGAVPGRGTPLRLRCAIAVVGVSTVVARRRADGVITVSEWLAGRMGRFADRSRIRVVPNGMDHVAAVEINQDRLEARRSLRLPLDGLVVLTVGRMERAAAYKGLELLADALNERGFFRGGGVLCAAGDGDSGDHARLTAKQVTVLGRLDQSQLATAYAAADLVASASSWEGFNLPLLEAQWLGLPVMALQGSAHPEVVHESEALAPTVQELADRIVRAQTTGLEDGPREVEGRRRFARQFTWTAAAARFAAAVEGLLAEVTEPRTPL